MALQTADADLDALGFLIGRWVGTRSSDVSEEIWTRVTADAMMGMFCWSSDDGVQLLEFLLIERAATGIRLTLRAFGQPGLEQRQPGRPLHWQLIRLGDNEVVFEGHDDGRPARIIYRREREDRMYAALEREEEGRVRIYPTHFRAAALAAAVPDPVAADDQ